jgi:D-alanyl-D-alanine carboxypeptidase
MPVAIAVRVDGTLRDHPTDLGTNSVFPVYSITKTLTAICALRLVELGALRLDVDVRGWLPEIELPAAVTLAQLLQHTSCLRDYGPLPEYHNAVRQHPDRPWTRKQFLDATLAKGLIFAPGDSWSYSNLGYMLVVDVLERVTSWTFAQILAQCVTQPLDLHGTRPLETIQDLTTCVPGFGSELTLDATVVDVRGRYHPGWCAPRVVASTPAEITRTFDALFSGELLAAESLRRMTTLVPLPALQEPPMTVGAGLGLFSIAGSPYGRNYGHGGAGPGYDLTAGIYLDARDGRLAIAVVVDTSGGPRAGDIEHGLVPHFFGVGPEDRGSP